MIVVSSDYLRSKEKILVKKYASYVMNKFVRIGILRKASIGIHVIDNSECSQYTNEEKLDFRSCSAWRSATTRAFTALSRNAIHSSRRS